MGKKSDSGIASLNETSQLQSAWNVNVQDIILTYFPSVPLTLFQSHYGGVQVIFCDQLLVFHSLYNLKQQLTKLYFLKFIFCINWTWFVKLSWLLNIYFLTVSFIVLNFKTLFLRLVTQNLHVLYIQNEHNKRKIGVNQESQTTRRWRSSVTATKWRLLGVCID